MTPTTAPRGESAIPADRLAAWRAFLEAHAHVTEVLTRELKAERGLPLTWYDVLVQLSEAEDHRLRMQDLASKVVLSKSGLTRLIDRMERAGLVRRSACPSDRRGTYAELTEEGYETLRDAAPVHIDGVHRHFTSQLDDDETQVLTRVMRRIDDRASGPTDTSD